MSRKIAFEAGRFLHNFPDCVDLSPRDLRKVQKVVIFKAELAQKQFHSVANELLYLTG